MKNIIIENLRNRGIENIVVKSVFKNSVEVEGLTLAHDSNGIAPIIYLNDIKKMIEDCGFEAVIDNLEEIFKNKRVPQFNLDMLSDKDEFLKHLFIGVQRNSEQIDLIKSPCEELEGDAELYLYLRGENDAEEGFYTCKINKELLKLIDCNEDEAWSFAIENTCKDARITSMSEMLFGVEMDDDNLYVLTNRSGLCGASSLIHRELLSEFAASKGTSHLIIIPSSVDEVLLIPGNSCRMNEDELASMIRHDNVDAVEPHKVLGERAYTLWV